MIKDFVDKRTAAIFHGVAVKTMERNLQKVAQLRLVILNHAVKLDDLRRPPSNRLANRACCA